MFLLFTILVFILDVGTGSLVAIRTKSLKSVYLKKPSILLGDFVIIPLVGGYILNYFYATGQALNGLFSFAFLIIAGFVAVILAAISALRFKTLSIWYLPHSLFYAFMAFWLFLFLIGRFDLTSISWWLVSAGIGTHLYLGKKYPKVFPKIK